MAQPDHNTSILSLSDDVLLIVFSQLNLREKLAASFACRRWTQLLSRPSALWGDLTLVCTCDRYSIPNWRKSRALSFMHSRFAAVKRLAVECRSVRALDTSMTSNAV